MKGEKKGTGKGKGKGKGKGEKYYGLCFLLAVVFLYLIISFLEPESTSKSLIASGNVLIQIIPVLLLVIFFMGKRLSSLLSMGG